jgi:hypothetical protein
VVHDPVRPPKVITCVDCGFEAHLLFDPTDPAASDPDGDSAPSTSASANLDPWDSDDLAAVPSGDSFDGEPDEISDGIALIYRCSGCGDRWDLVWSPDLAAGPDGA